MKMTSHFEEQAIGNGSGVLPGSEVPQSPPTQRYPLFIDE